MSYEFASSATSKLDRGSGTLGLITMMWVKLLEYTTNNDFFWYGTGNFDDQGLLADTTGQINATSQGASNSLIASGSDETWVFICVVQTLNTGLDVYYRHEGVTSLTHANVANTGLQGISEIVLGATFNPTNHKRITAYKEWTASTSLSAAQILAESTQNAPIVTTGLTNYLQCDAGHTIGHDQSAAAQNWTVTGTTVTTNADEPNMSIGVLYDETLGPDTIAFTDSGLVQAQRGDDLTLTDAFVAAGLVFDRVGGYRRWNSFD